MFICKPIFKLFATHFRTKAMLNHDQVIFVWVWFTVWWYTKNLLLKDLAYRVGRVIAASWDIWFNGHKSECPRIINPGNLQASMPCTWQLSYILIRETCSDRIPSVTSQNRFCNWNVNHKIIFAIKHYRLPDSGDRKGTVQLYYH